MNMSAIEEMIDRKIKEVMLRVNEMDSPDSTDNLVESITPRNCHDISLESAKSRNETGGVFDIKVPEIGLTEVYCDARTDGGNWIVFQRRMDWTADFNRDWNDYVSGFGNTNGEFWLGLEAIHQLTKVGRHELRFDMIEKHQGTRYYAKYRFFKVGPASDNYRLTVRGYSGNATDAFANPFYAGSVHNGMPFTTRDRDNDRYTRGNCATKYKGGWWFNNCHHSFLNADNSLMWVHQTRQQWMSMSFSEMKFRQKQ